MASTLTMKPVPGAYDFLLLNRMRNGETLPICAWVYVFGDVDFPHNLKKKIESFLFLYCLNLYFFYILFPETVHVNVHVIVVCALNLWSFKSNCSKTCWKTGKYSQIIQNKWCSSYYEDGYPINAD